MTTAATSSTIRCEHATGSGMLRRQPRVGCTAEARFLIGYPGEKSVVHIACAKCLHHYITSGISLVVALDRGGFGNLRRRLAEMQAAQEDIGEMMESVEWERRDTIIQDTRRYAAMVLQPEPTSCRMECCIDC